MDREEAAIILDRRTTIPGDGYTYEQINEAIDMAISALHDHTGDAADMMQHAHIDREAWTAEWKDFRGKPKCSACNRVFPEEYFQWAFCPGCGRAMKPDAWAVLEKMVRGCMG